MVTLKSPAELARMRAAGRLVAETLEAVTAAAKPGVTTAELDAIAAAHIRAAGARSSFLHYHPAFAPTPYPSVLCTSINDVVVHGIPDETVLRAGDVLSVDCGAELHGYHGDSALTLVLGAADPAADHAADPAAEALVAATERAFWAAVDVAVVGGRLGDISYAVQSVGRETGYGLLDGFGGHGVGTAMHEDPHLPNIGRPGRGMRLLEGLVLAIEPMLLEGGGDDHRVLPDGWAIATADGSRAAHYEHTVAITADGPVVLTARSDAHTFA